jgi:hypothetical protein
VYDHDALSSDDLACTGVFILEHLLRDGHLRIELHSTTKTKVTPILNLRIDRSHALLKTYHAVRQELQYHNVPHLVDDKHESVYLPLIGWPAYLCVEWEKGKVDLKLMSTDENVWCDWIQPSEGSIEVLRKDESHHVGDVHFVSQAKLNNIKDKDDFSSISMVLCNTKKVRDGNLDEIVSKAGWVGAMNYGLARQRLTGVTFDDKEEEIFFPLDEHGNCFFVCDFDNDDVDFKIAITPTNPNSNYDLYVSKEKAGKCQKKSCVYFPPKKIRNSEMECARLLQLDDVPYGLFFKDFKWKEVLIESSATFVLTQIVSLTL